MSKIINTISKEKKSSKSSKTHRNFVVSSNIEARKWKSEVRINLGLIPSKWGLKVMKFYSPDTRSSRYLLNRVHSEGL